MPAELSACLLYHRRKMRSLACVTLPKQKAPPETYLINDRSGGFLRQFLSELDTPRISSQAFAVETSGKGSLIPGMSWQGTEDQWLGLQ